MVINSRHFHFSIFSAECWWYKLNRLHSILEQQIPYLLWWYCLKCPTKSILVIVYCFELKLPTDLLNALDSISSVGSGQVTIMTSCFNYCLALDICSRRSEHTLHTIDNSSQYHRLLPQLILISHCHIKVLSPPPLSPCLLLQASRPIQV